MALTPGARVGPYEILAPLGAGGMGEVYRARDTKLNRDVAIKVLPDLLAADPQRRARLEREAQALAALNHPHIAQIYGVEESHGTLALVMELVEGPTLADRIAGAPKGLPVEDAIRIASQVAEALEAAHASGIIHRDLKPANIKVRSDGVVKVLDFGLARMAGTDPLGSASAANSPTYASPAATAHGVILGTAAYMAPEQARGQIADARSDLWAFGVVLYEMLTGAPLFTGTTISDVLASVLRDAPRWDALPLDTPPNVHRLLRRCLQKDPQLRLRNAGDARIELMDDDGPSGSSGATVRTQPSRRALAVAALAACVCGAAGLMAGLRWSVPPDAPVRRSFIRERTPAPGWHVGDRFPAISPDGRHVAYLEGSRLSIRALDAFDPLVVPGKGDAGWPAWSPDSLSVAFVIDGASLWRVAVTGGDPIKLCDLPAASVTGTAWRPDRTIVVSVWKGWSGELFQVPEGGGLPQPLRTEAGTGAAAIYSLRGLPDGSLIYRRAGRDGDVLVIEGVGKPPLILTQPGFWFSYSGGYLVYQEQGWRDGLGALPFDLSRRAVTGPPVRIATMGGGPSVSSDGTLVFHRVLWGQAELTWLDRQGMERGRIGQAQDFMAFPAVSPDGEKVAVVGLEDFTPSIWVHDARRGTKSRVTFSSRGMFDHPAWKDSRSVTFMSNWGLFASSVEGGEPAPIVPESAVEPSAGGPRAEPVWSRDGRYLVFGQLGTDTRKDIWTYEAGTPQPRPVAQTPFDEVSPTLSPDSRHVAYISDETGRAELFVRAFPDGSGKLQITSGGAAFPRWSPRGDEIFFVEGVTLMAIPVRVGSALHFGSPQRLFDLDEHASSRRVRSYDAVDGQRFVVVRATQPTEWGVGIVQNWFEEFHK
jgi:Tol biopolymer transport system component